MSQPPLVLVEWEDATQLDSDTWVHKEAHVYEPCIFQQVGFLLSDTDDGVILAACWQPGCTDARSQIPRGMIRKVWKLKAAAK